MKVAKRAFIIFKSICTGASSTPGPPSEQTWSAAWLLSKLVYITDSQMDTKCAKFA